MSQARCNSILLAARRSTSEAQHNDEGAKKVKEARRGGESFVSGGSVMLTQTSAISEAVWNLSNRNALAEGCNALCKALRPETVTAPRAQKSLTGRVMHQPERLRAQPQERRVSVMPFESLRGLSGASYAVFLKAVSLLRHTFALREQRPGVLAQMLRDACRILYCPPPPAVPRAAATKKTPTVAANPDGGEPAAAAAAPREEPKGKVLLDNDALRDSFVLCLRGSCTIEHLRDPSVPKSPSPPSSPVRKSIRRRSTKFIDMPSLSSSSSSAASSSYEGDEGGGHERRRSSTASGWAKLRRHQSFCATEGAGREGAAGKRKYLIMRLHTGESRDFETMQNSLKDRGALTADTVGRECVLLILSKEACKTAHFAAGVREFESNVDALRSLLPSASDLPAHRMEMIALTLTRRRFRKGDVITHASHPLLDARADDTTHTTPASPASGGVIASGEATFLYTYRHTRPATTSQTHRPTTHDAKDTGQQRQQGEGEGESAPSSPLFHNMLAHPMAVEQLAEMEGRGRQGRPGSQEEHQKQQQEQPPPLPPSLSTEKSLSRAPSFHSQTSVSAAAFADRTSLSRTSTPPPETDKDKGAGPSPNLRGGEPSDPQKQPSTERPDAAPAQQPVLPPPHLQAWWHTAHPKWRSVQLSLCTTLDGLQLTETQDQEQQEQLPARPKGKKDRRAPPTAVIDLPPGRSRLARTLYIDGLVPGGVAGKPGTGKQARGSDDDSKQETQSTALQLQVSHFEEAQQDKRAEKLHRLHQLRKGAREAAGPRNMAYLSRPLTASVAARIRTRSSAETWCMELPLCTATSGDWVGVSSLLQGDREPFTVRAATDEVVVFAVAVGREEISTRWPGTMVAGILEAYGAMEEWIIGERLPAAIQEQWSLVSTQSDSADLHRQTLVQTSQRLRGFEDDIGSAKSKIPVPIPPHTPALLTSTAKHRRGPHISAAGSKKDESASAEDKTEEGHGKGVVHHPPGWGAFEPGRVRTEQGWADGVMRARRELTEASQRLWQEVLCTASGPYSAAHWLLLESEITHFALKRQDPVTLRKILSVKSVWVVADFISHELPVRFASRIKQLEALPTHPDVMFISRVRSIYAESFKQLRMVQPTQREDFTKVLTNLKKRHSSVVPLLITGIRLLKEKFPEQLTEEFLNDFLNKFFLSRIGTEMLTSQFLAGAHGKGDGIIDRVCDPDAVIRRAAKDAERLCYAHYGCCPPVQVWNRGVDRWPYIPQYLYYILFELFKVQKISAAEHRLCT
ncbi:unnamed protein product [Vitrella brassicaformis CCMP3155]|uniref:Protein-serine/threonine kinase n=3 Tax=Vitrella brassicaformis TaxID=1169539 RepID=A0A0G4H2P2_VITBC|nr:unnamed protein product [Vitrella brassicaformis CCMP3155]|eukprot:CEM37807.1 unnamed protein product [Vitrella brassicaformis CCMP3155]